MVPDEIDKVFLQTVVEAGRNHVVVAQVGKFLVDCPDILDVI